MHTIGATDTSFEISIDGQRAALAALLPGFSAADRLGVVVRTPLAGIGASALIFAMVIDFYVTHEHAVRSLAPGELLYPEHYVVHVGQASGDYAWLDFWPPDKELVADQSATSATSVVQTLLDLGITRLLIEDPGQTVVRPRPPTDLARALRRQIVTALAFSATGRTAHGDVMVASNPTVEQWVAWTIDPTLVPESRRPTNDRSACHQVREVTEIERAQARRARAALMHGSTPVETYRRLTADEVLELI